MDIRQYIQENEPRFLDELFSLIRIPSISALPEHKDDMLACAERWRQLLLEAGADEDDYALGGKPAGVCRKACVARSSHRTGLCTLRRNACRAAGALEQQTV